MVRYLYDNATPDIQLTFRIFDGDHVEAKNIGRQPFSEEDIGSNKAVALSSAAMDTLGIDVNAYPMYLSPENISILKKELMGYCRANDLQILIGAVDNHACRKLLHKYFNEYQENATLFYIDSANEFSCGEIVIGKRQGKKILAPDRIHYYPDIQNDTGKAAYEMSCEELNASAPQHLATNGMAADLLFAYVIQLFMAGDQAHYAPGGIIYFDSFKLFSRFDEYSEDRHGKIE